MRIGSVFAIAGRAIPLVNAATLADAPARTRRRVVSIGILLILFDIFSKSLRTSWLYYSYYSLRSTARQLRRGAQTRERLKRHKRRASILRSILERVEVAS